MKTFMLFLGGLMMVAFTPLTSNTNNHQKSGNLLLLKNPAKQKLMPHGGEYWSIRGVSIWRIKPTTLFTILVCTRKKQKSFNKNKLTF